MQLLSGLGKGRLSARTSKIRGKLKLRATKNRTFRLMKLVSVHLCLFLN